MVIPDTECVTTADQALSGTVDVNNSAVTVSETNIDTDRIQCCL